MDYILTNNGAVLMTQVAAGRTLLFTRAESGSGYSVSPAVLQGVIDKKQEMFLDEVTYENRQAVVKTVLSNMQLEEEYQLRQVGVYAKLEGDEADTLLIIGQQYNGEKIPSYGDGIIQIEYNIAVKVSGTGNVTIEGVGTGYVTKGQFQAHLNDTSNPHKVTAKDVNLDKVPNVGTDDQKPTFEKAEERENIVSEEKLSVIFGKVRKWLADLKEAAFCSVANNLVTTLSGSVLDARQGKELQDQITGLYSDIALKSDDIEKIMNYLWPDVLPLFQNGKIYAGYTFSPYKFSGTTINAGVGGNAISVGVQGGDGSYSAKVDLTKFMTIKVIGRSQTINGNEYAAGFKVSRNADLSNYVKGVSFAANDAEYSIGVSDLSGEYYIGLYTHTSTQWYNSCIVSRILLE